MRSCHGDNPKALAKSWELEVYSILQRQSLAFDYLVSVPFADCGLGSETRCAFLDFLIPKAWGKVILEVDEDQHSHYPPGCDVRRDFDILASVAMGSADKLCVVRYNPNAQQIGGVTQPLHTAQREAKLLQVLQDLEVEPQLPFSRYFLYYNRATHDSPLPLVADSWPEEVKAVSRSLV